MDFFSAIVLGLIQGLTEFLPISSSAHVQIAHELLRVDSTISKAELTAFIATIQLGTELAVLIYFAKDIWRILTAWLGALMQPAKRNVDSKLGWLVILGSLPVIAIGLIFKDLIETTLRNLWVAGFALVLFGIILGIADRISIRKRDLSDLTPRHGLLFGLGQALAVIPGVSRSGGTISVGLMLGYTRAAAARFSFLLAIPAVLASGLFEFLKSYGDLNQQSLMTTAVATVVSFASGFIVISAFLKYLTKGSFMPFVIYRVVVGVALLAALSAGVLQP